LAATFRAIIPSPERDDGDEPRFVMRNHHQTASESVYFFQRAGDGSGDRGFHAVRFLGLGHKLDAQGSHRWNTGSPFGDRLGMQRGAFMVWVSDIICHI
jgi:hypothetical protein